MSSKVSKRKRLKEPQKARNGHAKRDQVLRLPDILLNDAQPDEIQFMNDILDSLGLPKESRALLSADPNANDPKSLSSFKANKDHLFDNITESFSSSKILSLTALSDVTSQKRFELSSWGLPPSILQKYRAKGISTMFLWQVECLANRKILEENKNLVYSAPTSAGKTLVSEFLIIKTVLERRKKAIFILPFVSVVREKMFYFQDLLNDSGVRVEGFMGGVAPAGGFSAVHVAIATIEKANSLINRLLEEGDLTSLGAVVIDELHLIGDPGRGYILELLLTKLRYMSLRLEHINIQLIGMSATLPNLPVIAEWLDAELYKTDYRPIPLKEQCKINNSVYDKEFKVIRELTAAPDIINDADNVIQLCIETISGGHGVLVFCPAKSWCEKLATQIAFAFFQLGRDNTPNGQILRKSMDTESLQEVLIQLSHCPVGLDSVLEKTVSFGVAFHHAGLTMDERDVIEGGFRSGSLKVLVATSTLSTGVNLPARRVIIRSLNFNGKLLDKLTYQQMIGRAGRMGKDTAGESILVCQPSERSKAMGLMGASLEPIVSCLESPGPLIRALLEVVASEIVRTKRDLELYCRCSFVYRCEGEGVAPLAQEAVKFLIVNEFLQSKAPGDAEQEEDEKEERLVATCLGRACLSASIPPRDGLFLFEELQRARKCLVLDTELHVVYLVTPFSVGSQIGQIDWMSFLEMWKSLPESERRVGQLVGVEERFLMSALRGIVKPGKALNIHRRFYTALALFDLVREVPLNTVCRKYNCCRGLLQSLQQSSSTFAGMVTSFCKELKWDCMELLFAQFQARLQFGVCRDLLDLLRLPSLNGLRARSLFKHGITSVVELAVASPLYVEEALNKALPFESEKNFDGENVAEVAKRTKMRTVFITGKDGLTAQEAARIVIKEARALVKNELGVRDVQWSQASTSSRAADSTGPRTSSFIMERIRPSRTGDETQEKEHEDRGVEGGEVGPGPSPGPGTELLSRSSESVFGSSTVPMSESRANAAEVDEHRDSSAVTRRLSDAEPNKDLSIGSEISLVFSEDPIGGSGQMGQQEVSAEGARTSVGKEAGLSDVSLSSEDVINVSDKPELSSRGLRSKLLQKSKSLPRESQVDIRSIDFQEKIALGDESPALESSGVRRNEASESFQVSERVLDEVMRRAEEAPEPGGEEPTRNSPGMTCNLSNRSPNLFSDSSFFDPQMCSILEKNVVDLECLADFEKSNFSGPGAEEPTRRRSPRIARQKPSPSVELIVNKENCKEVRGQEEGVRVKGQGQGLGQLSWKEDSWDQVKYQRLLDDKRKGTSTRSGVMRGESSDSGSPALLAGRGARGHLSQLISSEIALKNIRASAARDKEPDASPTANPKYIARKRAYVRNNSEGSPIASVRSYNASRPFLPGSSNKSDSDDTVVSSQTPRSGAQAILNKTRQRIDQKLSKSLRTRPEGTKRLLRTSPRLLKENCEASVKSGDEDTEATESHLMFESHEVVVESQLRRSTRNATKKELPGIGLSRIDLAKVTEPVNVVTSRRAFRSFRSLVEGTNSPAQLGKKDLAIAVVTELCEKDPVYAIGNRIIGLEERRRERKPDPYVYEGKRICGIVFSWGAGHSYYMPFGNGQDTKITIKERLSFLGDILRDGSVTLRCFNAKEVYKMLYLRYEVEFSCGFSDPNTGDWLLDPDSRRKTYAELAADYFPAGLEVAAALENPVVPASARASAKAVLAWYLTEAIARTMKEREPSLLAIYKEVEMPSVLVLASMELRGIGINVNSLQELSLAIKMDLATVEKRAYGLAGRKFNFCSSRDVAQVLGLGKKGRGCTGKLALKACGQPISSLVSLWRKLNAVLAKVVLPLLHSETKNNRIHGRCVTYTSTGRVSMHEPNLQTIPRDFESIVSDCVLSVRMAFVPDPGNLMLSADFSQLELRILAHYSRDPVLCQLLNNGGDVFKAVAARLNAITEDMVDEEMRQRAKQLCYAMIYGMGTKSLAETLSVTESEAKDYLESFMGTYKGIRVWLRAVCERARVDGFVTTLANRRRRLPDINSKIAAVKSHSERQAINTKVQGSAADIAKKAMVLVDERLRREFCKRPDVLKRADTSTRTNTRLRCSESEQPKARSADLVLQIHDELLYEVNRRDLQRVAAIVKESMERAYALRVPLPVKMKVGTAWGNLKEFQI